MSETNVDKVKEAYEAFGRGDIPALVATLAEDVRWTINGPADVVPYMGAREGRDAVVEFFAQLSESETITKFEPREWVAEGDKVVVVGVSEAEVRATGKQYGLDWVHVFTLRDGFISDFREFFDTARVVDAFRAASKSASE